MSVALLFLCQTLLSSENLQRPLGFEGPNCMSCIFRGKRWWSAFLFCLTAGCRCLQSFTNRSFFLSFCLSSFSHVHSPTPSSVNFLILPGLRFPQSSGPDSPHHYPSLFPFLFFCLLCLPVLSRFCLRLRAPPGRLDSPFLRQQHSSSSPSPTPPHRGASPLRTPPHTRKQPVTAAAGRYSTAEEEEGGGAITNVIPPSQDPAPPPQ